MKIIQVKTDGFWENLEIIESHISHFYSIDLSELKDIQDIRLIEDKQDDEIEKLDWDGNTTPWMQDLEDKLNEIIKAVNKLNKTI